MKLTYKVGFWLLWFIAIVGIISLFFIALSYKNLAISYCKSTDAAVKLAKTLEPHAKKQMIQDIENINLSYEEEEKIKLRLENMRIHEIKPLNCNF